MTNPEPRPRLDVKRIKRSGIGYILLLIVSSEIGLAIGVLVGLPMLKPTIVDNLGVVDVQGYGIIMGIALIFGSVLVPVFGLIFGMIGASCAREGAIKGNKAVLLKGDHPLRRAVHGLARELGLNKMPDVGIYPDKDINAFAAGWIRGDAVVCFTQGLLERCTAREVLAIAAHEVAHVANNDMFRMQFAWSFQNALTWYLFFERPRGFVRWLLGTVGELLILRLSRQREYWADATAAAIVGKEPMIEALQKLDSDEIRPSASKFAYARLMIRSNPDEIVSTHPPIAKRIRALERETFTRRLPYTRLAKP